SWEANIDGLIWFNNEIWPAIKQQHPGIILYIVGRHPDNRLKEMAAKDDSIVMAGFVEDLEPYFRKARLFITPLRFGSGIKVKVVNALYRGIPCVTTSIGTEGLKVKDGEHIFIKDQPKDYITAVDTLLKDKETWEQFRNQSRAIARKYYTWDYVLENIRKSVEK
ncbi:MAG TPA: glycosyltransferase family 4 protein, partial [Chitinophagales bacterium]|nr:glycosyltransferase family 4 protein [Chitinophagales bacterium]